MKAVPLNSEKKVVTAKMRDEIYMRHLREVQRINNREAEAVARDIRSYRSINDLHHRHKSYAFQWHNRQEQQAIHQRNLRINQKIREIKPYFQFARTNAPVLPTQPAQNDPPASPTHPHLPADPPQTGRGGERRAGGEGGRREAAHSLHYRYRKRRQEEIEHENDKLAKGIMSQRSSYLPQIAKDNRRTASVAGRNSQRDKSEPSQPHQQQ